VSPVPWADDVLGLDAVLCLVACLAVTPFITVARLRIARLRWWYGTWMFALGIAAVLIHMAVPPAEGMAARMAGDAVSWTGVMIVVLLLPLAATSSALAQRLLGPEWKRWQRALTWLTWALVLLHLAALHAVTVTGAFLAASLPLVLLRFPPLRRAVKSWRSGGYSTGGLWIVTALLGSVLTAGLVVLVTGEVLAIARAVTLVPA